MGEVSGTIAHDKIGFVLWGAQFSGECAGRVGYLHESQETEEAHAPSGGAVLSAQETIGTGLNNQPR